MIFLTGAGGHRVDTDRAGQTAVIARQRSGDVGGIIIPEYPESGEIRKAGSPLRCVLVIRSQRAWEAVLNWAIATASAVGAPRIWGYSVY
jgi:hypothetical protein